MLYTTELKRIYNGSSPVRDLINLKVSPRFLCQGLFTIINLLLALHVKASTDAAICVSDHGQDLIAEVAVAAGLGPHADEGGLVQDQLAGVAAGAAVDPRADQSLAQDHQ